MSEEPVFVREDTVDDLGFAPTEMSDEAIDTGLDPSDPSHELPAVEPTTEEQRATYGNWLTEQGVNPKEVPHLTMGSQEFDLFRGAPADIQDSVRRLYDLPQAGDVSPRHALVEVEFDGPDATVIPALVDIDASDFGTVADYQRVADNTERQPLATADEGSSMFAEPTPRGEVGSSVDESAAEQQRAVFAGWLEERGVVPTDVPKLKMGRREFDMFRNFPSDHVEYAKDCYGLRAEDQVYHKYVWVDAPSENSDQPAGPQLVEVSNDGFGRIIDRTRVAEDLVPDQSPDDPTPGQPEGAYRIVDIADDISAADAYLGGFAERIMAERMRNGVTENPFHSEHGESYGIRAGGLMPGQTDAYVRTDKGFSQAVQLTLNDSRYGSVCVVAGEEQGPANGKDDMAQIINPRVVLMIQGEDLKDMQAIYQNLYREPDYKLTPAQQRARDTTFNKHLMGYIATQAGYNQSNAATAGQAQPGPQVRYRS